MAVIASGLHRGLTQRQSLARWLAFLRGQESLDLSLPGSGLRQWLPFALAGKVRLIRSQYFAYRVAETCSSRTILFTDQP